MMVKKADFQGIQSKRHYYISDNQILRVTLGKINDNKILKMSE